MPEKKARPRSGLRLVAGALIAAGFCGPASAQAPPDLWRGKQIILNIGYGPGGGYDNYARLIAHYLGRYLPGNPSVVTVSRPGAGSIKLANELYNAAPGDGTVLGMIGDVLLIKQVLGEPEIKFVTRNFNWIGRLASTDPVLVVRPQTGIRRIADAKQKEIHIGVPGAGSATAQNIRVLNNLAGTKFKLISGYSSSTEVRLAVERGEADGSGSVLWGISKDWIAANNLTLLYQVAAEKAPDLPEVPRFVDLGETEDQRRLLRFFASYVEIGRAVVAPPTLAPERTAALRAAFQRMAADPALRAEADKQHIDLSVLPGEKLQAAVEEVSNLPARLRDAAVAIVKAGGSE
jgi:tripartite-type tricarboxylate transporter receptor subunit TctC